jgi:hypothetical protein
MIKKKSKAQRIRELLEKGKSAHYISNTLNVTLQNIYNVRWHMKNQAVKADALKETTIMPSTPPKQLELDFAKLDEVVNQHQAHIKAHVDALNERNKTESIQGEYGKYQQMSVWQRIKSALGV